MFDALSKLSNTVPDAYHRASEFKDLHLGDLHLIKIDGLQLFSFSDLPLGFSNNIVEFSSILCCADSDDQQNTEESKPLWVAVAVTQSYNPRRKVPRSSISIPDLESCLAKASFSASQKSGNFIAFFKVSSYLELKTKVFPKSLTLLLSSILVL